MSDFLKTVESICNFHANQYNNNNNANNNNNDNNNKTEGLISVGPESDDYFYYNPMEDAPTKDELEAQAWRIEQQQAWDRDRG